MVAFALAQGEAGVGKQAIDFHGPSLHLEQDVQRGVKDLLRTTGIASDSQPYVLLALKNDGEIAAFTSKKIRSTVQPVILDWGRTHLRLAHEHSGFVEDSDDDDASAMTRFTTLNDPDMSPMLGFQGPFVSTVKMKTDDNARTATTRPDRRKPGENPLPPQSKCDALKKSFRIDDEKALLACLTACIDFIGHQIFKNIAKNWIKGICPRKQARFPYRDEKSRSQGKERRIPLWWPALEVCKFTEPDHIDKKARLGLVLHLLRLRPSVEDLTHWNKDARKTKPNLSLHQDGKWTVWLNSLASDIYDLDKDAHVCLEKTRRNQYVMEKMYEIAAYEEEYKAGCRDGSWTIEPLDNDILTIKRSKPKKRSRQTSCSSAADTLVDGDTMSEGPPPKKSKFKPKAEGKVASTANPLPSKGEPTVQTPSLIPASYPGDVKVQRMSNIVSELNPAFTTNTSFGSTISDASSHDIYGAGDVPSVFRGREASVYRPSGPGSRNSVQVHQVVDVPQPQFDTAPNTPIEEYIDYKPIDSHMLPRDTYNMNALSNGMPIIGTSHGLPGTDGPVLPAMHGLPTTSTAPGPYEEWAHAAPYSGFVPQDPNQGWAVPYYHHPQSHPEDEPFDYHYQGPNHEMPGAPLPANVIRGFTGHASGVGDSACPPGFTQYSITM